MKLKTAPSSLFRKVLWLCVCVVAANSVLAQSALRIARIEAEGLQTLTADTVIAGSGLKVGDPFSVAALDTAAQRLVDSGLFKNVGYRTRTAGAAVTVIFQLEEVKGNQSPVILDNFIWFSDEELADAIRREVPSYNGSAPDTGNSIELIRQALQNFLESRKMPGRVEYMLTDAAHLYSVTGVPLKICTLHFPGAHDVSEEKLIQATRAGTDPNYSRQSANTFPKYGLFPLYREIGHLRASFGHPIAKPDTNPGCEGGVDLTIPVVEGLVYSWEKAEWSGNQALSANQLDEALGMRSGEVANGNEFDKRTREVEKAYGKQGYIEAHLESAPRFDDAAQRVTYSITVKEGSQYRMGTVDFKGFSDADVEHLRERWELKSGTIYDQSYAPRFFRARGSEVLAKMGRNALAQQRAMPNIGITEKPSRLALTVDVVFEIKN